MEYIRPFAVGIAIFLFSMGQSNTYLWDMLVAIFLSLGLFRVGIRLLDWFIYGRGHWKGMVYDPFMKKWVYRDEKKG